MKIQVLFVFAIGIFLDIGDAAYVKCPEVTCREGDGDQYVKECSYLFGTPTSKKYCDFHIQKIPGVCGVELELMTDLTHECGPDTEGVGNLGFTNGADPNSNSFNRVDLCEEDGRKIGKRVYLKFSKKSPQMTVTYQGTFNFRVKVNYMCCKVYGTTNFGDNCCPN